ncbi:DUF1073 domain-containing protein [Indiicoccus explosivorum]|uniref:DUF1073 domain-containing protein n=1 Tax=Indiicoccus explosivorum TaxID=1917864 RepID=UPI000B43E051|nr:anti-CBASS Acb1 family protein [Indiicoccus explosivorum]
MTTTIERAKQFRNDFMQGNGKGGERDALVRQNPGNRRKLSKDQLKSLYASNIIVQNIINIPAEDMTRSWFTLKMKDEKLRDAIMQKLRDLKAKEAFKDMRRFERLSGDGLISLGVKQSTSFTLDKPIEPEKLMKLEYIHAFSGFKVENMVSNNNVFSPDYGSVEQFELPKINGSDKKNLVHASRILHDQTRRLEDEKQGQPLLEPLFDIITVMDTSLWSVGQILYDFTFKTYSSKDIEDMKPEERRELGTLMDFMFRTEALAIIGEGEKLEKQTTNAGGIKELLDYGWDMLAGGARMPKTVIKGQEAGTIAGAQYDVMNYYSRIAAMQENEMKPLIEKLIRMLLWCSDELGGRVDPASVEWEVKFNPLWEVDGKTDAEIRKLVAETDDLYITNGVLTTDEVREARFGRFGLEQTLAFSGDEADYEKMAAEVYAKRKESLQNG